MECRHPGTKLFHVCEKCGEIATPSLGTNYFEFFGLAPTYFIDEAKVQNEFYALSRILHPDRFHGKSKDHFETATQSFAVLNKALTTLKSSPERAHYLFELVRFAPKANRSSLPTDLAESYFELQEDLEDQALAKDQKVLMVNDFSNLIKIKMNEADTRRDQAFKEWEQNGRPLDENATPYFERAATELNLRNYLDSMTRDLVKKCQT